MALSKYEKRIRSKKRIRKKISGTEECPRMSVFRSNKHISVQIIDDVQQRTIVAASLLVKDIASKTDITKSEQAVLVGKLIAEKAKQVGIKQVTFDRNGYLYHGRVKALADAVREGGLVL